MSNNPTFTDYSQVPWHRRWLNVGIIWLLLMPVGVILMWTGEVYRNKKDEHGGLIKMTVGHKAALTGLMLFMIAKAFIL